MMDTNEELRQLMRDNNLSQVQVSEMLQIPLGTVKNYGRTTTFSKVPKVVLVALRLSIAARERGE